MDPMKIGKQPFYIFQIKFMMCLDNASTKFPIPWLRKGEKGGGKFAAYLNYFQVEESRSPVKIQIFSLPFCSQGMENFELA